MFKKRVFRGKRQFPSVIIPFFLLFIIGLVSINLFKVLNQSKEVSRKIKEKEEQIKEMQKKQEELLKKRKRLSVPFIQEKEIRRRLDFGRPGEKVIFISSLKGNLNYLETERRKEKRNPSKNNLKKWWNYFFSREK